MVPFSEQSGIIASVMDGGANINLITRVDAQLIGLEILRLNNPVNVKFGKKDAKSFLTEYIYGGKLLGKIYIIEDGEDNHLLGVSLLTEKNMKVIYEFNSVTTMDCNGEVLMIGIMIRRNDYFMWTYWN